MRKRILSLILAVIFVFGSIVAEPGFARAAARMTDDQWKQSLTGSAGVLEGKSVIISIFISDKNTSWPAKAKKKANRKVKAAGTYIKSQAKKYGKQAELITDIYKYEDICYSYKTKMKLTDSDRSQNNLYAKVSRFIDKKIDLTAIREKYDTDSIGFLFHINKSGISSTLVHYVEDGSENFYECSSLFSKYEGQAEGASTYAHEILHLFGARDLYEKCLTDRITSSFVKYVERKFPNDIMYSTYTMSGKQLLYRIKNDISRVTAYFLGWKKSIPEKKKYALPAMEHKGCFTDGTSLKNK